MVGLTATFLTNLTAVLRGDDRPYPRCRVLIALDGVPPSGFNAAPHGFKGLLTRFRRNTGISSVDEQPMHLRKFRTWWELPMIYGDEDLRGVSFWQFVVLSLGRNANQGATTPPMTRGAGQTPAYLIYSIHFD